MMGKSEIFTLDFNFPQKQLKNETKFISKTVEPKPEKPLPHSSSFSKKKKKNQNNFLIQ